MNTSIVTCRQPNGEVVEQRVKARNHHEAQRMLEEAGRGEVVILDRETRADHVVNRRVRGIVWAIVIALPIAAFAAWKFLEYVNQWVNR